MMYTVEELGVRGVGSDKAEAAGGVRGGARAQEPSSDVWLD